MIHQSATSARQGGYATSHMLDVVIFAVVAAGSVTTFVGPELQIIGVSTIGSVIGGLMAARMFLHAVALEWAWGLSMAAGVVFSPALFDYLTLPRIVEGVEVHAFLERRASYLLAASASVSLIAWGTLGVANTMWLAFTRKFLGNKLGVDPNDE